ncbi:hypothetical protein ASPZODRAFT_1804012 [Penicilliopsis zonata CBS 506.65]|uniref:Uncharacterized protein n=1 Tax=Penicilliopsis zonata CBS 506.65 TaxID=1073090 RepID=A0A1L9SKW5_9EURO|nr:hypothetical protein ASPZODRAFT_1804012 [Penicilliopsis zonata CBS 506.65]OJJ47892.1 hypothetical protein ASPZODRAFT_1804012 [Penicilliopsis zonata CBS 506.65]
MIGSLPLMLAQSTGVVGPSQPPASRSESVWKTGLFTTSGINHHPENLPAKTERGVSGFWRHSETASFLSPNEKYAGRPVSTFTGLAGVFLLSTVLQLTPSPFIYPPRSGTYLWRDQQYLGKSSSRGPDWRDRKYSVPPHHRMIGQRCAFFLTLAIVKKKKKKKKKKKPRREQGAELCSGMTYQPR